ncbi:MAG: NAD-dependent epimerase/dehydratase family protein [Pseudomonadota bacterium]
MKGKTNVAITGSTASISSSLAAELCRDHRYENVVFIDSDPPPIDDYKILFKPVDLMNPKSYEKKQEILESEKIGTLVHCAFTEVPSRTPQLAHELETVGTMNVLSASARAKTQKIILYSRTFLYGAHGNNPQLLREHHPIRADRSFQFFADKMDAERLLNEFATRHADATVTILRVCPIIGPRTDNVFTKMLSNLFVPVIAGFNPLIQLIHHLDAVRAFKIFCDNDFHGVYNVIGRGYMPLLTAIHLLGNIPVPVPEPVFNSFAGSLYSFHLSSLPEQMGSFLKYSFLASGDKAAREAGYSAIYSIKEVIEDFYRYWARRFMEK